MKRVLCYVMAVWLMLAAPAHAQAPRIPDAMRFYPDYRAAYTEAIACAGITHPRPYEKIVWLRVPRPSFLDRYQHSEEGKLPNIGEWVAPDTIYIAAPYTDSWVPKHEMIHYLRQDGVHTRELFGDACHATWGFLPADTTKMGVGTTIRGPAWKGD